MHIKHSLNILMARYGIIFKVILYCLVALLFIVTIAYSIASPLLSDVAHAIRDTGWSNQLSAIGRDFLNGDEGFLEAIKDLSASLSIIVGILKDNTDALIKAVIVVVVFLIVALYVLNLANIAYSDVINHFMNSNSRFGFLSNFFYNLKKSALYGLLHLVTKTPLMLLATAVMVLVAYGMIHTSWAILALPIAYIVGFLLYTTINVIFMGWVPAIVADGVSVAKALGVGCRVIGKHFGYAFMNSFMSMFLCALFIFMCSMATFGAGLLIAVPTAIMFRKILELVLYYSAKGYKFYINDVIIIEGKLKD